MFTGINSPEPPVFTHVFHFALRKKDILQLPKYNIHVHYLLKKIYHGKYSSSQWFLGSKPITTFTTKFGLSFGLVI